MVTLARMGNRDRDGHVIVTSGSGDVETTGMPNMMATSVSMLALVLTMLWVRATLVMTMAMLDIEK